MAERHRRHKLEGLLELDDAYFGASVAVSPSGTAQDSGLVGIRNPDHSHLQDAFLEAVPTLKDPTVNAVLVTWVNQHGV
ncbi:MAG: hypothetical protein M1415_00965 [Firmicutes bacterium]|jgi:hypothetical protein|nr:hypothetical protein [Bacillota bacterium]MCL5064961.1 hypothetical protein [Bacillota bacterium]